MDNVATLPSKKQPEFIYYKVSSYYIYGINTYI